MRYLGPLRVRTLNSRNIFRFLPYRLKTGWSRYPKQILYPILAHQKFGILEETGEKIDDFKIVIVSFFYASTLNNLQFRALKLRNSESFQSYPILTTWSTWLVYRIWIEKNKVINLKYQGNSGSIINCLTLHSFWYSFW